MAAHRPDVVVWMSVWESVDRYFDHGAHVRPGTVLGNARLLAEIDKAVARLRSGACACRAGAARAASPRVAAQLFAQLLAPVIPGEPPASAYVDVGCT